MDNLLAGALWMAALVTAWTVVVSHAALRPDARLQASGARGLRAAGGLLLIAAVARTWLVRADALTLGEEAGAVRLLRETWAAPDGVLLTLALFAALAAAAVPRVIAAIAASEQGRARMAAGAMTLASVAAAIAAASLRAPGTELQPTLLHWSGLVAYPLYLAACGLAVVPVALGGAAAVSGARRRWLAAMLALFGAATALVAWSHHAGAARPPELDVTGAVADTPWTTLDLVVIIPMLLTAAAAFDSWGADRGGLRRSRVSSVMMLAVGGIVLAVAGPAILDWVAQRDLEFGTEVPPIRGIRALVCGVAALGLCGLAIVRAMREQRTDARLWHAAQAATLLAAAVAAVAVSVPPARLELEPGVAQSVAMWGQRWTFTSQGPSQVEGSDSDAALVAFEIGTGGDRTIETAGERVFRGGHGTPAARIAVPGIVRSPLGDLRFTVRALRGDAALVRVQFHPLATLAWLLAGTAVALLVAAAVAPGRPDEAAP